MADTLQNKPVNQRIIRDRLAAWESKTNSKATLTDKQKDSIVELTTKASERPIPSDVSFQFKTNQTSSYGRFCINLCIIPKFA